MLTDICKWCGKPIYHGTRTKGHLNDPSRWQKIWRHVDTEHRKCAGPIPHAWPVSDKRV